jgi:hypothetical protein
MTRGLSRARRAPESLRVGRTGMGAGPRTADGYGHFTESRP